MRKKGFTLIELLAVIVILSVIALITIPIILGVIERIQVASYKESLRSVFSATDLYIASSEFGDIPDEGINVTDENIRLKNKSFTSGKIIKNEEGKIELDKVSDGNYCGSGTLDNLIVIEGSCDSLDETPPTITVGSSTITSKSITIVADAEDLESGINGYEFSIDNGATWTSKQPSNVYTFTNLTNNISYTFKVKVYNNNLLSTESDSLEVTTSDIALPTYSIDNSDWTDSAVVTIAYPERQIGYLYEYSLDEGITWEEVISPAITKDITFTDNGNVIARISDGTNIVSGATYEVTNIDTIAPIITVNPIEVTVALNSTYNDTGVVATDNADGDITDTIIITGSVDTSTEGTYTLTYNVSDTAGNAATPVIRTVEVLQLEYTYDYTGSVQTWVAPVSGTYKMELWGSGNRTEVHGNGGGGYVSGNISVQAGETYYVYVGTVNNTFNGGGNVIGSSPGGNIYGNGATDIRLVGGAWNGEESLNSRIIVAGAGGSVRDSQPGDDSGICTVLGTGYHSAGGLIGDSSLYTGNCSSSSYNQSPAGGGTQTSGGVRGTTNFGSNSVGTNGSFGVGGSGGPCVNSLYTCTRGDGVSSGAGGGGGYYGGGGARGPYPGQTSFSDAGSGSSFISGHVGSIAITSATDRTPKSSGTDLQKSIHYSGKMFTNTVMIDGSGYSWNTSRDSLMAMPNPSGGYYPSRLGHTGSGQVRITLVS